MPGAWDGVRITEEGIEHVDPDARGPVGRPILNAVLGFDSTDALFASVTEAGLTAYDVARMDDAVSRLGDSRVPDAAWRLKQAHARFARGPERPDDDLPGGDSMSAGFGADTAHPGKGPDVTKE